MNDNSDGVASRGYAFGPFRLLPTQHLLLKHGAPIALGSRALDILTLLVERAGSLVTKRELMAQAWGGTVVEDANIKAAVAALRRTLGDGEDGQRYLINIPRRGYQFVVPVVRLTVDGVDAARTAPRGYHLPAPPARMVGRADAMESLAAAVSTRRLVTISGPGGIGKTTIALAVASSLLDEYEGEVCFVDLGTLLEPTFVAMTIANALGLTVHAEDVTEALVHALRGRRLLLLLDSCELVLQATAELADRLLSSTRSLSILATSREPLRIAGEKVYRLGPLSVPPESTALSAADALEFPAVALFVDRAGACLQSFRLDDADTGIIAEICRKLDGVPLAIELTATRADTFALRELSELLEDRVRLLSLERRSTLARHVSLQATIDWSFTSLPEQERTVLRRIAVFPGTFDLACATAVASAADDDVDIIEAMDGLVTKSLVIAQSGARAMRYRLFDSTRSYAVRKLAESGEWLATRRRHATHLQAVLARAERESHRQPGPEWLAEHGDRIHDVRSAIAWAASDEGDVDLALALTMAAIPLWMQLSLLDECRVNIEWAVAAGSSCGRLSAVDRMKLHAAQGTALLHAQGPRPEIAATWTRALEIADQLGDHRHQCQMLWALAIFHVYTGEYGVGLRRARRFRALARATGDRSDQLGAERLIATLLHYLGRHGGARRRLEPVLLALSAPSQPDHIRRFQLDQRVAARGTLANLLWMQGQADEATAVADDLVREARAAGHPLSLCNALAHISIPIALHRGDADAVDRDLAELLRQLSRNALPVLRLLAACLEGIVAVTRGNAMGVGVLDEALRRLTATGYRLRRAYPLSMLALGRAHAGEMDAALTAIDEALSWSTRTAERWYLPESLRIKAELLRLRGDADDRAEIERLLREAMQLARHQNAPTWERRAAASLAQLLDVQDVPPRLVRCDAGASV